MPPNSNLILGDSLKIRASITDRNGNLTIGTPGENTKKLVYDPDAPLVGQIIGGNMFDSSPSEPDTIFSNDTLSIQWSAFVDEGDDASGFDFYQIAFKKVIGSDTLDFHDWETVEFPTVPDSFKLFLEHKVKYLGYIRGFDKAGNISDTLISETLTRYNTKPTIRGLDDALLDEDVPWTVTFDLLDPDTSLMQGDSFTYEALTINVSLSDTTDSVTVTEDPDDYAKGILSWTPAQRDTGTYEIQVIATDAYELADTFKLPLFVTAVNDAPVLDFLSDLSDGSAFVWSQTSQI